MTEISMRAPRGRVRLSRKRLIWIGIVIAALAALVSGVKVVDINSAAVSGPEKFSPAAFGRSEFPKVQQAIIKRAVPATTLAAAIAADPTAAGKKYGVDAGGIGPEMSVSFTGVVGRGTGGVYPVKVTGVPKDLLIRIQTGPAINGTDLRDAPGTIAFGQFVNQIDYQNAGAALNDQLKQQVLSKVDPAHLAGKTVSVVGAFQLVNPKGWLVTPVKVDIR
jgi:predicted lipoprotein